MGRWNITPQNFVAHGDIAPGRKQDVSGYFNWTTFYAELGIFPGLFVSNITADQQKGVLLSSFTNSNVVNANVTNLQQRLSNYGYVSEIDVNGFFDAKTEAVVEAFNRHFCPEIFVKEKEHTYDDNSSNSPNQQWYGISEERLTYLLKNTNRDLCPQC
uniref:Peptidoglycan binding-like domain-containing protein n=1 Tax=Plectus sambesii TaxID=2011161 RepID=A0A914UKP4_9BILA